MTSAEDDEGRQQAIRFAEKVTVYVSWAGLHGVHVDFMADGDRLQLMKGTLWKICYAAEISATCTLGTARVAIARLAGARGKHGGYLIIEPSATGRGWEKSAEYVPDDSTWAWSPRDKGKLPVEIEADQSIVDLRGAVATAAALLVQQRLGVREPSF